MKPQSNQFLPAVSLFAVAAISPLTAQTIIDTTGNPQSVTATLVTNTRYTGNGTVTFSLANPPTAQTTEFGPAFNTPASEFAMASGGLITIDSGVRLLNGGNKRLFWGTNLSDMTLNGSLDLWDGNPVRVDELNGAGAVSYGLGLTVIKDLTVGVDGGNGTFSGTIQTSGTNNVGGVPCFIRLTKAGGGTQTLSNLANQKPGQVIINAGAIDLSTATAASMPSLFTGAGNLIKSGAGALTLSNAMMVRGITTVSGGTLGLNSEISARANLVAAPGTTLNLNFTGQASVSTLDLGGSGLLAAGIYDSTNVTYGSFFTGTGQLNVIGGAIPTASGTWASTTGGFWNVSSRWQSGVIANGADNTATIGTVTPITVTFDSSETIGNIVLQGANHTLAGTNTLTLAGTTPSVTVATGTSSRIESIITGTAGLAKNGDGTLTIAAANPTYTGGTAVNAGRLTFAGVVPTGAGTRNFTIASGATLEFNVAATLSGGTFSGAGTLVKSGSGALLLGSGNPTTAQTVSFTSGAVIDIQGGLLRNEFGNSAWSLNKADLNVAATGYFDTWDGSTVVDAITGSGTINKAWPGTTSITFGADNGSGTFSGKISAVQNPPGGNYNSNQGAAKVLNLIKTGTGTQTFSGVNTYTGTTAVNAGTLALVGGSQTSAITVAAGASLGFTLESPTTSTAAVNLTTGTVKITGSPTLASHLLMTASSITGTPTLDPAIPDYELVKANGDTELRLNSTSADPFTVWAGPGVNFNDDANNDGVKNGLAWFLGALDENANATGLLPKITQTAGALVLEFDCLDAARRGTVVFNVQYSSDLGILGSWAGTAVPGAVGTFTAGVVDFTVTDEPVLLDGLLKVVATIPVTEASAGKLFGRVEGSF